MNMFHKAIIEGCYCIDSCFISGSVCADLLITILNSAHLATSGLCPTSSNIDSVLIRKAQHGKHASSRIKIAFWVITPTRCKLPAPKACKRQCNNVKKMVIFVYMWMNRKTHFYLRNKCVTCWGQAITNTNTHNTDGLLVKTQCTLINCLFLKIYLKLHYTYQLMRR